MEPRRERINLKIGAAVFSEEPVATVIEFPDHEAVFDLRPITQKVAARLEQKGIRLGEVDTVSESIDQSRALFEELVTGWRNFSPGGVPVPYSDEKRDDLAVVPEFVLEIVGICRRLGVEVVEAEQGN